MGLLIAFQLAMLVVIGILLIQLLTHETLPFTTIFSSIFLILFCMPLSLYLGITARDSVQKKIFLSFAVFMIILIVSGILWDIVPMAIPGMDLAQTAKILTVLSYLPFILGLLSVLRADPMNVSENIKRSIAFVNVAAAALILLLVAVDLSTSGGNTFDVAIYTSSTIVDIAILSICSILALNFMQNQLRYVFLIMLVFFILSLAGDSLSLLGALGLENMAGYVQFLWDMMFILTAITLMAYSLSRNREIVTVEEVNRTLHDTKSLLGDLILQSPEAIGIFDARGDELMANQAFLQITGGDRAASSGKINIFRDMGRISGSVADIALIRDGGTVRTEVARALGPGGEPERYYQLKVSPAHDSGGLITGYIVILVDISDRKRYEEELVRAKTQAELYIDLLGHDINNMNQIGIGFLEMALDRLEPDNEGQLLIRKPLEAMLNSSHLIDNVKKIRRANTGSFCLEPVDLGQTLDEVIRDYKEIPGRDTMIDYIPTQGYYVLANPLLKDVFSNLINNSFKHSTGPLKIWVKVSPVTGDRASYYQVAIEDNGPGIPGEARRVLQEHAYSFKKRSGGGGLGLYLVKVLVDSFKGSITVEDRMPGDARPGTRITITLPAVASPPGTTTASPSPATENSPGRVK
ncbi:MAG: ATP-binding protein [Betaproteobacteria bacterium]